MQLSKIERLKGIERSTADIGTNQYSEKRNGLWKVERKINLKPYRCWDPTVTLWQVQRNLCHVKSLFRVILLKYWLWEEANDSSLEITLKMSSSHPYLLKSYYQSQVHDLQYLIDLINSERNLLNSYILIDLGSFWLNLILQNKR